MCTVSMIIDHTQDLWKHRYPGVWPTAPLPGTYPDPFQPFTPPINRQEFDALKREVEDLKKLLVKAKKYDEETNQKDCEMADKVELIKRVARLVGVDLSDLSLEGKSV